MIYIASLTVFMSLILLLVLMQLLISAAVVRGGTRRIVINGDDKKALAAPAGTTLLKALVENDVFLPSACGGGGSCGQCRCRIVAGGGDILPTELPHLSRREKKEGVRLACQVKIRDYLAIEIPPEIFEIRKYAATVVSNRNIGTFIKELVIAPEAPISFDAGQYMQIDIPAYALSFSDYDIGAAFRPEWEASGLLRLNGRNSEPTYRAYSLASPPSEARRLAFTVRIATPPPEVKGAPPGIGSAWIFSLGTGDLVSLSGPYGDFRIKATDREICFLGGGAGMAPLRSQIRDQLLRVKTRRKITFWYGARSRQEMLYDAEFREIQSRFDNFSYHVALSEPKPEDRWEGPTGFIHRCAHDRYLSSHPDPAEIEYYLCGPPLMIAATLEMIDSLGVEPEMIAYDAF